MPIKQYKHLAKILNHRHDQSYLLFSHRMKCCQHRRQRQRQQLQQPHLRHGSSHSFITVLGVMSMMLLLLPLPCCVDAVGYSYTRFIGPVAGPEHKVYVNDATHYHGITSGGRPRLDYVAKPEYEFAYGVEDADAHILHNRNEMRDGDAVKGVYSLIDPDGALRVVKYTADEINGFQAEVIRNGVSSLHGQLQHDYERAPPSEAIDNRSNHNSYYHPDREQHHYPQSQTHLKADTNNYYPSSNVYAPNLDQLQHINHQQYNSHNQHQTPPQPPIIYHANNNDDDDDGSSSNDSDSDYHDDQQLQYEVHEKHNNYDHENQEDDHYDEDDIDHKSKNAADDNVDDHKKKKHHPEEDDDDDDDDDGDDYDDEDESEELEDYDEAVHNANNRDEESDEYY